MKANKLNNNIINPLDKLLSMAKTKGITQKELAARSGISEVGLSQAKRRGNLQVSTLEALADTLGLAIDFIPRCPRESVIGAIREGQFFHFSDEVEQ